VFIWIFARAWSMVFSTDDAILCASTSWGGDAHMRPRIAISAPILERIGIIIPTCLSLTLADWTGMVETDLSRRSQTRAELFAQTYKSYDLAPSTLNQEPSTFSPVTATVAGRVDSSGFNQMKVEAESSRACRVEVKRRRIENGRGFSLRVLRAGQPRQMLP